MKLKEALLKAIDALKKTKKISGSIESCSPFGGDFYNTADIEAPAADARALMCHVLRCDRVYLYTHGERVLTETQIAAFNDCVKKRLEGIPVSYITGHREFMSLDFRVTPDVLIPRPETEILVETVIGYCDKIQKGMVSQCGDDIKILDIGTGSGCIGVSLAYYIRNCLVTAVDISEKALDVARINASSNDVSQKIQFVKSDMFSELPLYKFDIIASNPPYISENEIKTLQCEVAKFEPLLALSGGVDGLDFYRRIVSRACNYLKPYGMLIFEVGYNQAEQVMSMMKRKFYGIKSVQDLSGIDRVIYGKMS